MTASYSNCLGNDTSFVNANINLVRSKLSLVNTFGVSITGK